MRRGMNSMEMQKNNRILVFKTLQEKGMMTRAELAVELNLQKATITNIINEFFEMGIVEVNGETAAGRRGEKLNLKLDDIYTMSIGITRKDYQLAIFDLSGNMIKHSCCNFQKDNSTEYHKRANFPENIEFSGISLYSDKSIRHHKNTRNFNGN